MEGGVAEFVLSELVQIKTAVNGVRMQRLSLRRHVRAAGDSRVRLWLPLRILLVPSKMEYEIEASVYDIVHVEYMCELCGIASVKELWLAADLRRIRVERG